MRKIDKYGYTLVESGLITSFTASPYPPSASETNQTGVLLEFDIPTSTSRQTIRLFRGRTLIATMSSDDIDLSNTQIVIDIGAPFGQSLEYHLEVFKYDTDPTYQYMTIGYTTPSVAPVAPTISSVTTISDSSDSTTKTVELEWTYDPQSNPAKNPTHFLIEVKDGSNTLFSAKSDFFNYRYLYRRTVSLNIDSSSNSIDVEVSSVRGSLSATDTEAVSINQFNLLPTPTIVLSNLATKFEYNEMEIPLLSYSFDVTISMPSGVGSVDSFHIVPTASSVYFDPVDVTPTANSFSFSEDNISITTFPNYTVYAVVNDSKSPEVTKQFSIADIPNIADTLEEAREIMDAFVANQEETNKISTYSYGMPASLGMPVLSVYYNGSSIKDWVNNQTDEYKVPYLRQSVEQFDKTENDTLMWEEEENSVFNFIANRNYDSNPIVSYSNSTPNFEFEIGGSKLAAQRFTWTDDPESATNAIQSVQVYLAYVSGPGEDIFVDIYSDATEGGQHYPGTKLNSTTGIISGHTNAEAQFYTCTFETPVTVTYDTDYWIVVWADPSRTKYKWLGYTSETIFSSTPAYYSAASQISSNRLVVFDEDDRVKYQGKTYNQALAAKVVELDSTNFSVNGDTGLLATGLDLFTKYDIVEDLDTFISRLCLELNIDDRSYSGPCIIFKSFPSTEVSVDFSDINTSLLSSFVRVGSTEFLYGRNTDTTRVSDVSSKINAAPGYKSYVLSDMILDGGELEINFGTVKYYDADGDSTIDLDDINPVDYDVDDISVGVDTTTTETHTTYDNGYIVRGSKVVGRYLENTKIHILPPYENSPDMPWYPRIDTGRFSIYRNDSVFEYSIAEYPFQSWSETKGAPYKDVWGETPAILDSKTLRLNRSPIADMSDIHITVNGSVWNNNVFDVDKQNGIILLKSRLPSNPNIQVDYCYVENSYEYPFIDINPAKHRNSSIRNKYVGIFLTQMYNDIPSGETDNNDFFTGTDDKTYFGRRRTVFHRVFDTFDDIKSFADSSDNSFVYLLGYYYVTDGNIENVTIKDARRQGGGLSTDISSKEAIRKNRGARGFYDVGYFDGEPFSESHVIIRLPEYLKEQMDEDKIIELSKKYLAFGVMPIITFYKGTRIDVSNPDSSSIFPLPEQVPSNQLTGYGVEYGSIYGIK